MQRILFIVLSVTLVIHTHARAHEGDIGIAIEDGAIRIGGIEQGPGGEEVFDADGPAVFGAELGELGGLDGAEGVEPTVLANLPELSYITNEPGFDAEPGTFPATVGGSEALTLTIRNHLMAWTGSDFAPTGAVGSATESMQLSFFALQARTDNPAERSLTIPVQDDGGWHKHVLFALFPNEYQTGYTAGDPIADAGIYLLELELSANFGDLPPSDPLWIVFNFGMDEASHDAAIGFVESNLAGIPEPGSAVLLIAGAAMLMRRRR